MSISQHLDDMGELPKTVFFASELLTPLAKTQGKWTEAGDFAILSVALLQPGESIHHQQSAWDAFQ